MADLTEEAGRGRPCAAIPAGIIGSEMTKYVITTLVSLLGGSVSAVILTRYLAKNDYEISATSCSEEGYSKVFIENLDNGYRIEATDADVPVSLDRITKITNTGTKMIDGETINVSVDNDNNGTVFEYLVFYSNQLDRHEISRVDLPNGSKVFAFKFKQFNPNDQITILTNSTKQLTVSANSKGNGYTYYQRFGPSKYCKYFDFSGFGGKIVYSSLADGCKLDPRNLNLHCEDQQKIHIPESFPPGKSRIVFEEDGLFPWISWWPRKKSYMNFTVIDPKKEKAPTP